MPQKRWGMAPFNHDPADPLWSTVNTRMFLAPDQQATTLQAGVAVAFVLPSVARLAVGTHRLDHLATLHEACQLALNTRTVRRYRAMLYQKATIEPTATDQEATRQS
jgi:pyridoxine 4-dehydrogenase